MLALPFASVAQVLPSVDVISTTPLPGVGLPKAEIPANVQTATSRDIDESQATDLADFMRRRLGSVHINDMQSIRFKPTLTTAVSQHPPCWERRRDYRSTWTACA